MSPVNYHLELPMQWSIHPVFHTDLLTPYHETIMHRPKYQHPSPDLVDNAEEYEVKRILDSWQFSRRCWLQYLVKWKGYLESDNMWVNKDDMFTDDKVQAFKESNPNARMHLRTMQSTNMHYFSCHFKIVLHFSLCTPHTFNELWWLLRPRRHPSYWIYCWDITTTCLCSPLWPCWVCCSHRCLQATCLAFSNPVSSWTSLNCLWSFHPPINSHWGWGQHLHGITSSCWRCVYIFRNAMPWDWKQGWFWQP